VSRLRLRLLGGFGLVREDGQGIALPTRKGQALLARLGRRPGEEVAREHLVGLLWPDVPDEQGRASLRQALAAVRRALGAAREALRAGERGVSLDREVADVDVAQLERGLLAGGVEADALLLACAEPFLAGFPPVTDVFDDWAERERAALSARLLDVFRARLDALVAAGEVEPGLALAERALSLDPAFEPAYRARMRLLARAGDPAAALREWERCRDALRRVLAIAPSGETEALHREIARGAAPGARDGAPAAASDRPPSLSVLPFEVLSAGATDDLFARGLAEDLLVELSRFRSLRVVAGPRPAAGAREGTAEGASAAPRADWLLHGSIRVERGRLRVNVRLLQAATGHQAWAERYVADLADVLSVQDRMTRAIAGALALRIDEAELDAARRRRPESLEAWGCWLRGMNLVRAGTREADLQGRELFARALELDPAFARAWVGLSLSHFNDWSCVAWDRWEENEREALRCAREALRLDDRDHVPHCILGRVLLYQREWEGAAEHFARALALNASDPDMLAHLAAGYAYLGEPERATELARAACEINPLFPDWYRACAAVASLVARRPQEAIALLIRAPDAFVDSRAGLASACGHVGRLAEGGEHATRFLRRFRAEIVRRNDATPVAALEWLLLVNPFRRAEDREWLLDGLARVGLAGAVAAASAEGARVP
jgi:DNA-binding SARP family transcriptional activator